jgi:N-acyl-D-amino-acid deacylase
VRGGLVADGTGAEPFEADIAVDRGRIAQIGRIRGTGTEEIDARGKLVTPGFIDIHIHYYGQAVWSSGFEPSSSHGVTTVMLGNCGMGFAPRRPQDHETLISVMEGVEDIPGIVMAEGLSWDWETFPEYLDGIDARPHDIDFAVYMPHSPLRVYVMGKRGADREPATPADLAKMQHLMREGLDAGAIGFATSRYFLHRTRDGNTIPTYSPPESELYAITDVLKDAGRGIIQVSTDAPTVGFGPEIESLRRLAQRCGRPVMFPFGTMNGSGEEWRGFMAQINDANREGACLLGQIFPRPVGMILGFNVTMNPFCLCPTYRALGHLPLQERVKELKRPEVREKLLNESPGDSKQALVRMGRNFEYMFPMGDRPDYEPPLETSIANQARMRGVSPEALAYDLMLERDGNAMLVLWNGNYQNGSLEAVYEMLQERPIVIGLGDGGAHYGMICDASYPTHVLTHWARDRKGSQLSLGRAAQVLAADPARTMGLSDRGILALGYKADLNVIDHDKLSLFKPEVRFDLPNGGRRLHQRASGYEVTMVSGKISRRNDQATTELPGRLVRAAQAAAA